MIKKLIIKNFRNLAFLELNFNEKVSIITGKNELGKSNALNALCWLLTNTILTDKWGTGENDIDSIIPKNAIRGINPEVAIELESGAKFSKKYISKYSKSGDQVIGHTTEWYINDVACRNETEFKDTLYPVINYNPSLKTKDVNELRLFTDPLYALQKLDAKSLRALLVDLGCSVSNEEMYKLGFEDLKPYGDRYLGKWDVLRKELKDNLKVITKEIESLMAKLETVSEIEDFDETYLKNLNEELESLITQKANLKNNYVNQEVSNLEKKIAVIESKIQSKLENHANEIQTKKSALLLKRQTTLDKLTHENETKLNPINDEIGKTRIRINDLNNSIKAYDITINQNSSLMTSYIDLGKKMNSEKTNLALKLDMTRNAKYTNYIVCPICGTEIAANPEEQARFEAKNKLEADNIMMAIDECERKKNEYRIQYDECKKLKNDAVEAKERASVELVELENKLQELESQAVSQETKEIDMTEINKIDAEISDLDKPADISKEQSELRELTAKLQTIREKNEAAIQDEIDSIENKMMEVNDSISQEYIKKSKAAERDEYQEQLNKSQFELNEKDSLLQRVNYFIQKMISKINQKATEKTGLTFVMLEENLTNDGIKEVCYATVDGIPFKDVNTAKKLKYGIKFIEKMKSLLGRNEIPILADRMEGIDKEDTIKSMTTEQMICTRVSNEEAITIR